MITIGFERFFDPASNKVTFSLLFNWRITASVAVVTDFSFAALSLTRPRCFSKYSEYFTKISAHVNIAIFSSESLGFAIRALDAVSLKTVEKFFAELCVILIGSLDFCLKAANLEITAGTLLHVPLLVNCFSADPTLQTMSVISYTSSVAAPVCLFFTRGAQSDFENKICSSLRNSITLLNSSCF